MSNYWKLTGAIGPSVFILGWLTLSISTDGYSMVNDPISRLAAKGADTQALMTTVFVLFGICLIVFGLVACEQLGNAWIMCVINGAATIGVAATPLDTAAGDHFHNLFAAIGYLSLALTPLLARSNFVFRPEAFVLVMLFLILAIVGPDSTNGLFQRLGLTIGDAWLIYSSVTIFRMVN